MKHIMACVAFFVAGLIGDAANARYWRYVPKITVISPANDSRLRAADEAVAFWNRTLAEIGSGFRLGAIVQTVQPISEQAVQQLSQTVLSGRGRTADFPPTLRNLPGDITIVLAASEFISFSSPFNENGKIVIGIRGTNFPPMNLPNVPRNVIAHELGHSIGLRHNNDPAMLMCGRPSPCRPGLFRSDQPRIFPLTADEKRYLLMMYPPQWKSQSR